VLNNDDIFYWATVS